MGNNIAIQKRKITNLLRILERGYPGLVVSYSNLDQEVKDNILTISYNGEELLTESVEEVIDLRYRQNFFIDVFKKIKDKELSTVEKKTGFSREIDTEIGSLRVEPDGVHFTPADTKQETPLCIEPRVESQFSMVYHLYLINQKLADVLYIGLQRTRQYCPHCKSVTGMLDSRNGSCTNCHADLGDELRITANRAAERYNEKIHTSG